VGVEVYPLRDRIISDSHRKLLSQNPRKGRAQFYFSSFENHLSSGKTFFNKFFPTKLEISVIKIVIKKL